MTGRIEQSCLDKVYTYALCGSLGLQSFQIFSIHNYFHVNLYLWGVYADEYRQFPARSSVSYIRAPLIEWVHKPWLLFRECFPSERLWWFVYEIQHYKPWLVSGGSLNIRLAYPMNFFPDENKPHSNISSTASDWGLTNSLCVQGYLTSSKVSGVVLP